MRFSLRSVRRLLALAFSWWVIAVLLTSFARDATLCRHLAMHEGMPPEDRSGAACWCSDMTSNTTLIAAETPSLPADIILMPAGAAPRLAIAMPLIGSLPPSPSYAPTPPPPNQRYG